MKRTCTASPDLSAGRTSPVHSRARPGIVTARALLGLAVAVSGLALARGAQAQEPTPQVTIEARHATALQGIDDLLFTVTRSVVSDDDLEVPVTLSSGIIAPHMLSHTVTIPAGQASADLRASTRFLDVDPATGDVTATVGDGENHDLGDPSTASVRLYVASTLVTVRLNAAFYRVPESIGTTTDEIVVIARTQPGIPPPYDTIDLSWWAQNGTAESQHDYAAELTPLPLPGESQVEWVADGDAYVSQVRAELTIVDDEEDEEDETISLAVWRRPDEWPTVRVVAADSTAPPCEGSHCYATATIVDNDTRGVTVGHTGTLSVEEGGNATYTVVLDSRPTDDVTITPEVQGAADADITVSGALRFGPWDWRSPKTVTVRAATDDNAVDGSASIAHTVAGGDYGGNGVTAASVAVTEADLEHSGDVTIEAEHPTALEWIDDLVFTVTRTVAADHDLVVPVTLSSGILNADRLSQTVTIAANEASAELRVHTRPVDPAAMTGDVTATVEDGESHDVGDPSSATVRVYVAETLVTVRLNAASYTLDEGIGTTTDEIRAMARTEPGVPAPNTGLRVSIVTDAGTAAVFDDYNILVEVIVVGGESGGAWAAVDDAYESELQVPLTILDDDSMEGDETFSVFLQGSPGLAGTVALAPADDMAAPCTPGGCESIVTIVDDDGLGVTIGYTGTLSVDEGGTASYTAVLDSKPTGDVTVTPEVRGTTDDDISVSEALVFTPQDWNIPQTVAVTAAADSNTVHGSATIIHTVTGGDYESSRVTAASVQVAEVDREAGLEHSGDVTIAARHSTALQGIDDLVFTVTRTVAAGYDLDVPVTLSSGIIDAGRLSHTVTVAANETSAELAVDTQNLDPAAATGDVTATVGDGVLHDVGDPSSAVVQVHVGGGIVTVGFGAATYRLDESVGTTTTQISLAGSTNPGVPAPRDLRVAIWTVDDTATSGDDYIELSTTVVFPESWTAVESNFGGDAFVSEVLLPLTIIDDDEFEGDETFTLMVGLPQELSGSAVALATHVDAPPCDASGCGSYVSIVDDDAQGVTVRPVGPLRVEEGETATYTVVLNSRPTSDVTVTPTISSATDASFTVSEALRFAPPFWAQPQTVTVRAAVDENNVDGSATITHTVEGGDYEANGVTAASVEVVEEDSQADLEHSGDVTIAAKHATALQGIDDLVFTVTREIAAAYDLEVPVTLSSGIIAVDRLSHTVTIGANEASAELPVRTDNLAPGAATGDVIATVGDGVLHDVGDPSSATVRVHVGETLVKIRLNAASYTLEESIGTTTDEISLIAVTEPGVPAPSTSLRASLSTRAGTAGSPDDYEVLTEHFTFDGAAENGWVAVDDFYRSEIQVPLTILDDGITEGTETFQLLLERAPSRPSTVMLVTLNSPPVPCESSRCEADVTIVDDDVEEPDPADQVVVTLVHVPDGTVIPADSTVGVGATVVDGATFSEDERVYFRLLFESADGGRAQYGADVELRFEWTHHSPIVPISGQVSLIELSLYRVDVWDSAVQILDNDVGNPDGTMTARITGCERNGCVIGTPSEITVTIADDDGGPAAAPPGPPDPPRLVCASAGDGYDATGIAASWTAPTFVGGAPVDGYDVQYHRRIAGSDPWAWGEWQDWGHAGTATSTTITGLDADALYRVRVRAVNATGHGQWSLPGTSWTGYSQDQCEIVDELTPGR